MRRGYEDDDVFGLMLLVADSNLLGWGSEGHDKRKKNEQDVFKRIFRWYL